MPCVSQSLYHFGIICIPPRGCYVNVHIFSASFLPFNPSQACGEFGSVCSMVCDALTTLSVTRTVFRTRAIYVIMWTGHGYSNLKISKKRSNQSHKRSRTRRLVIARLLSEVKSGSGGRHLVMRSPLRSTSPIWNA